MARAQTPTWLSLDRWAEIIGVNPLAFNSLDSNTLFPGTHCGNVWMQYAWQFADQTSREDVAQAIREAEDAISNAVGYALLPSWVTAERQPITRPADPTLLNVTGRNILGFRKSVQTNQGYVLSGGFRGSTVIQAGAAVVRTDEDGDSYAETMTVTVPTTVTDPDDIRVYFPNQDASPEWEVRPIKVALAGGNAVITFKSWLLVDPNLQNKIGANAINAENAASYLSTVDVYRIYNDPSVQIQMLWEECGGCCGGCVACQMGSQYGCMQVRDNRLGHMAYSPANWNSEEQEFETAEYSACREPDRAMLWYYAGWQGNVDRPRNNLDPYWESAIAYFAASLLDRPTCGCSNVTEFIKRWRTDRAETTVEHSFQLTNTQMDNNFGSTAGAWYAWQRTRQPNRKIGR